MYMLRCRDKWDSPTVTNVGRVRARITHKKRSTCTKRKNCMHRHMYSVPHSLTHARGYTVELISGWRGSSRDNLTRVVVVHLVEGREPRVDESKFDHDAVACLFLIFFLQWNVRSFFLEWHVNRAHTQWRSTGWDGSHGHGRPFLETTTLVLWCTFKKTTTLMCHVNSQNDEKLAYYALYIAHTLYG